MLLHPLLILAQAVTTLPTTQAVTDAANKAAQPAWVASCIAVLGAAASVLLALRMLLRDVDNSALLKALVAYVNRSHARSEANEENVKALAKVVNDASAVPARVELAPLPPLPPQIAGVSGAGVTAPASGPKIVPESPRIQT